MFKKLEERLNMLNKGMEDIFKILNQTSADENDSVFDEKYTGWDKKQTGSYKRKN